MEHPIHLPVNIPNNIRKPRFSSNIFIEDTEQTSCTFTQYINDTNVKDKDKINVNMRLKLNNCIRSLHSRIHVLCLRHWFNQSDDNFSQKNFCDYQKYDFMTTQDTDSMDIDYDGNMVDKYPEDL